MATTVKTIFDAILPRIQQINTPLPTIIEAVNESTEIIFDRLFKRESDLVRRTLELSIPAGENTAELPAGFRGLAGRPFVKGEKLAMMPATESVIIEKYGETGTPGHYELMDENLAVYPSPEVDTDVIGRFYEFPTLATSLSSVVPFRGVFDRVYREAAIKVCLGGPGVVVDPAFASFLYDAVDDVLSVRQRHAPIRRQVNDF
jgi:hypothetical protein